MTGLYIHIPLCQRRCGYCDFYKVTLEEWPGASAFVRALEMELGRLPADFAPDTVFIGGGTPTALGAADFGRLLAAVRARVDLSNVVEFTSEANPGTLTAEKLAVMAEGGVNRVSMGVQSFNDQALRLLGRIHDAALAEEGFGMLRAAGFDNVNIDLIQSIPGMAPSAVLADARRAAELGPEHISYYNLIYEPGTSLAAARDAGRVTPCGEDEEADNYSAVRACLMARGYGHYEISNFAREGRACRHNLLYWRGGEYLGCGPAAHSHWRGARFGNVADLGAYARRLAAGARPFDEIEVLPRAAKARETLVMWLRETAGVDLAEFRRATGLAAGELGGAALATLLDEGLLVEAAGRLRLAEHALFISNAVFSELV